MSTGAHRPGPEPPAPVFSFILQPEFPLNALVLASEALRIANQNSGAELFRWHLVSETGDPVRASNGMWIAADHGLQTMPAADVYLVFEGNLPTQRNSPRLLAQLRAAGRHGAMVGAVDTGAFALAQAGLIGERDVVVHWEAAAAFRERFPDAPVRNQIYQIDGARMTCAGGVATLDLMLDLIGRLRGPALAFEVANALVHTPRPAETAQRADQPNGRAPPGLTDRLVGLMEAHLDFPLPLDELAAELGVSPRTLTRTCHRRFGETPMRLYLRIRLQAARNLLFYEDNSVKDVAIACGFSYPTVFSRAFKAQFGQTPRAFRTALRHNQSQSFRPEIRRLGIADGGAGSRASAIAFGATRPTGGP